MPGDKVVSIFRVSVPLQIHHASHREALIVSLFASSESMRNLLVDKRHKGRDSCLLPHWMSTEKLAADPGL